MTQTTPIPQALADIIETFQFSDRQEKMDLLLEFAEKLRPIPQDLIQGAGEPEAVPECMTPVSVFVEKGIQGLRFYFEIPPESPTIRGFAAIVQQGLWDVSAEEILAIPQDFFLPMGLHQILTPQRMNGLIAIMAHVKHLATQSLASSPSH